VTLQGYLVSAEQLFIIGKSCLKREFGS